MQTYIVLIILFLTFIYIIYKIILIFNFKKEKINCNNCSCAHKNQIGKWKI